MKNCDSIRTIIFSPTGTSKRIAEAITRGIAAPDSGASPTLTAQTLDLTHAAAPETTIPEGCVAVIAVPVYGGHIAPAAAERLRNIRGSGGPAVVVAVYGNRAFEHAVTELAAWACR